MPKGATDEFKDRASNSKGDTDSAVKSADETGVDMVCRLAYYLNMKWPSPTETALLDLMGTRERTGREIAEAYAKEHGTTISYGTLYTALRRLKEGGWIDMRDDEDEDGRLRYYTLSGKGAKALPTLRKMTASFGLVEVGGIA